MRLPLLRRDGREQRYRTRRNAHRACGSRFDAMSREGTAPKDVPPLQGWRLLISVPCNQTLQKAPPCSRRRVVGGDHSFEYCATVGVIRIRLHADDPIDSREPTLREWCSPTNASSRGSGFESGYPRPKENAGQERRITLGSRAVTREKPGFRAVPSGHRKSMNHRRVGIQKWVSAFYIKRSQTDAPDRHLFCEPRCGSC